MAAVATQGINRAPRPSSLADVLEVILDKGIVIDAYVRVALVGIEILTIDARIVIASVDTYLRFAEAVNRLDLGQQEDQVAGLPGLVREVTGDGDSGGSKTKGALSGIKESFSSDDDDDEDDDSGRERSATRRRSSSSRSAPRSRRASRQPTEES
ncbi:gas vesicle protein GvpJ [Actinopolymorpha singaporensis]|uniref:Gas vesicle protein A n=1 Tax=Actinopolymorpha singaporensis TaxID=117157 RepID=A0A1H1V642_9ACTN|nr:gas vesicle protein GvpJ [Actinopolymorpha singaporensis]SDS80090.1 Gas vesicle protein [Actinopolymorpha singaporensis]